MSQLEVRDDGVFVDGEPFMFSTNSRYAREPFSNHEIEKIKKMVANGTSPEAAGKTRIRMRRKRRVARIEGPDGSGD